MGVDTAPMEKVKMKKEEEEENPDVHFKQKQKGKPHKKRVVKKSHLYTLVIAESESM